MFRLLGNAVASSWRWLLTGWLLALAVLVAVAPQWNSVVEDGEFVFLPDSAPSLQAERTFQQAFPDDLLGSSIVLVVRRDNNPQDALQEQDREFIDTVLKPRLEQIARETGGLATDVKESASADSLADGAAETDGAKFKEPVVAGVRTYRDRSIGPLLESRDKKASLVIMELATDFFDYKNSSIISRIEELIDSKGLLRQERLIPAGLDLALSGSATVGRDMKRAAAESADATETWTVVLVLALLIVIYRAPLLSLIPLMTVAASVAISLSVLALLAQAGILKLFAGIEVYVTVIVYGAGVDYCLFLIARYKEELDGGATCDEAVAHSLGKVGAALTASAGTVMCGIGMMVFAEFGKFQQAGVGITLSLFICLCAALTFTPSLLLLAGRWAFWPNTRSERIASHGGWVPSASLVSRLFRRDRFRAAWGWVGQWLTARPGWIWLGAIAAMIPFAVVGVMFYSYLSYGLLSELPATDPSVVGTRVVQKHFPAGATGPVTILVENRNIDFGTTEGIATIAEFSRRLEERRESLGISDIRSVAQPLGITEVSIAATERFDQESSRMSRLERMAAARIMRKKVQDYYVSEAGDWKNHVTRIDVVFQNDPFSRDSIQELSRFRNTVNEVLPDELRENSILRYLGPTPSIYDLKITTDRDQIRIEILVIAGVFFILVVLLGRPAISAYLILSVFFSYLVTLGATFALFYALDPAGFAGLDWKVPLFLFTILIAVGEDYNIFLMTRIDEEQAEHGPVKGITVALQKTGSIISSCGFIMAGTFSSLLAGSLVGMNQLGFALAFGVLLDTFIVRPVLVPAYLILLNQGRFGALGKYLGAEDSPSAEPVPASLEVGSDH
jgi:RND superfamily putative drug exporter